MLGPGPGPGHGIRVSIPPPVRPRPSVRSPLALVNPVCSVVVGVRVVIGERDRD